MFALLLALTLPLPILQGQPITRQLSTRWHPTVAIETGLNNLAFIDICPATSDSSGRFFAGDSAGSIVELAYVNRQWKVLDTISVGERVVAGCAAAMRPDEVWSLIVATESGKVIEMRRGIMGWGYYVVTTVPAGIRTIRATEPARPGPSQLFVIDVKGAVSNWYVGASGRWNQKSLPSVSGGSTHICFDYSTMGLTAVTAGLTGVIYRFAQDSMGDWSGVAWDTLSSGCRDLAAMADPSMKDICIVYAGLDGHLRYLFFGRKDDVTSRLANAEGAYQMIGKGDQRRYNEFFGMARDEFCLFEYDPGMQDWIKVSMRSIPSKVVATAFGPARASFAWHTIYVATVNGTIYEFERDGLENE